MSKTIFLIAWVLATGTGWGLGSFPDDVVRLDVLFVPTLAAGFIKNYTGISVYVWVLALLASIFVIRLVYLLFNRRQLAWSEWLPAVRGTIWAAVLILALAVPTRGSLTGLTQWLVLRHQLPTIGWSWILASTVAPLPLFFFEIRRAGYFPLDGIAIGVLQWLVLRQRVPRASWWILASGIGWMMGQLGLERWSYFDGKDMLSGDLLKDTLVSILMILDIFLRWIVGGMIAGLITGTLFVWSQRFIVRPNTMSSFKMVRDILLLDGVLFALVVRSAIPLYQELAGKYIQSYLVSENEPLEITRLEVLDDKDQLIWVIENTKKAKVRVLNYGIVPSGFIQRYPISSVPRRLQRGEHVLVSYTASTHSARFEMRALKNDRFRVGARIWSSDIAPK